MLGVIERTDILIGSRMAVPSQTVADIMRMPVRVQADDSLSNTRQRLLDAEVTGGGCLPRARRLQGSSTSRISRRPEAIFSLMDRRIDMPTHPTARAATTGGPGGVKARG